MPDRFPPPNLLARIPSLLAGGTARFDFFVEVVGSVARALTRHVREGRPHAEWTLSYDLAMSALRQAAHAYPELSKELARSNTAPMPLSLLHRVRLSQGTLAGLPAEIHTPRNFRHSGPTVLYLHGGGYVTCSPRTHRDVLARIANASGARCIAPDYRLAPAHPFPAALDDAFTCYRDLLAAGQAPERLFVGGDSAGGGLTLALMQRLRDARLPMPRALVLLSPWVDLSLPREALAPWGDHDYLAAEPTVTHARAYAGSRPLTHPLISPIYGDMSGLPPMLVQTGEWELLREQNIAFVRRVRAAGGEVEHGLYPGMLHAFTCFAGLTAQGKRAIAEIGAYLHRQLTRPVERPRARAS